MSALEVALLSRRHVRWHWYLHHIHSVSTCYRCCLSFHFRLHIVIKLLAKTTLMNPFQWRMLSRTAFHTTRSGFVRGNILSPLTGFLLQWAKHLSVSHFPISRGVLSVPCSTYMRAVISVIWVTVRHLPAFRHLFLYSHIQRECRNRAAARYSHEEL